MANERETPAVAVDALTKRYGDTVAVAGVSLVIPRGAFMGLVGPNGAGKTTSMRMMTGLLRPDSGAVAIAGIDVWGAPRAAKARIGVLPEDLRLFDRLSGRQLLEYTGLLRGLEPAEIERRSDELLSVLGLEAAADDLVIDYSHGMSKKVGLGAALLHAPDVLFLDEPFEAIDPVSVRTIRTVLERYCAGGSTVIFSSHVMDTVERLCDRVAILDRGTIIADGSVDQVRGGRRLDDVFAELVGAQELEETTLDWLGAS